MYLGDIQSDITSIFSDISGALNKGQVILNDAKGAAAGYSAADFAQQTGLTSANLPWLIIGGLVLVIALSRKSS